MSNKTNRIVPKELKEQILERVRRGEVPITQIAAEHGIHTSTIYNWLGKGVKALPSILELSKLKKENQALHELIGRITVKLDLAEKKNSA